MLKGNLINMNREKRERQRNDEGAMFCDFIDALGKFL